jgi:hypothetical protein
MEQVAADLVREGVAAKEFVVADEQVVTTAVLSLGIDVSRWFRAGHRLSPDELADAYADLMIRSITPSAPATSRSSSSTRATTTTSSSGKSARRTAASSKR